MSDSICKPVGRNSATDAPVLHRHSQEDPPAGVSGAPGENNIMLWNAVIFGPHETPFEVSKDNSSLSSSVRPQDGTFKLTLEFSEEYPNKPPVVKFLSKVAF